MITSTDLIVHESLNVDNAGLFLIERAPAGAESCTWGIDKDGIARKGNLLAG